MGRRPSAGPQDLPGLHAQQAPHAITLSRANARSSPAQFRDAFAGWLATPPQAAAVLTDAIAVDGKASKQGHDAHGDLVHMLNVFAHELNLCLSQFPQPAGSPAGDLDQTGRRGRP